MNQSFISSLSNSKALIGTLVTLDSSEVVEILALAGFDWLFLDMEHGNLSIASVQRLCQAIAGRCHTLVRVPENAPIWIKKVLDIGCDGIIVPHVNTAEEAMQVIQAAKYQPKGQRSVGAARAQGYGHYFSEYVQNANNETTIIIQIEDIIAVQNLDTILKVPGIDGVLIGPYDLSGSMNLLGEVTHPLVQAEINKVKLKCKETKIPFGIFVMNVEATPKEIADGCGFVAIGTDSAMVLGRAKQILETIGKSPQ
ncbi:MAG: 2-dehydro-3-deoxyglucarate aldolase [Saprospiraceae bacterium]|nr:2-dehydro-3-deoxyglucarate aldolase [Saprospiraceae bacterium]